MTPPSASRPRCPACLRPPSACICRWATPVAHRTEVLILQHPLEVHEAKGTARLLHLCLPHSRMVTGERLDASTLQQWLTAPFEATDATDPPRHALLLYPEAPQGAALGIATPPPLDPAWLQTPERLRLVVLDGTWRKSRKMLHLNPLLQQLPRLPLRELPASRYRIRAARQPHQLSTLEATCAALAQLEGSAEPFEPLLSAFDGFVAQQAAWQGR
ncbi:DTW domain-containing protein [Acidovorax carolinensis]|uniref:tRNA-uridine aminocarboxypropyltransferase n=1 Tax=Acidovorax carolinensis TaxID=553814 RepID=A0A240TZJ0_9BURK|nr:tRNA-uridine aminocarboxypropyltransferase [Acidovorax carolinensis]ART51015.1 DTW domain-containing protein [Acidovorax carolinensis]